MNPVPPPASRARGLHLLSIVSPVHNESDNLDLFVSSVTQSVAPLGEWELILVDDGSSDDSWIVMRRLSASNRHLRCLRLSRNFGKEAAISAGLEKSRGDVVVVMDSDLQHPPVVVPDMVERWREGADVVEGVKKSRTGQSLPLRGASRVFNAMFSRAAGMEIQNATDFKTLDRKVVDAWRQMPERTLFFRGMSAWLGFDREQLFFDVPGRESGMTKWGLRELSRLAINGLTSFTSAPLQIVSIVGVAFGLFALVLGGQTLAQWLLGRTVEGFTTVILLLLLIGCAILLGLGIIGEYVARIHDEVKGRPRYVVADSVGYESDLSRSE